MKFKDLPISNLFTDDTGLFVAMKISSARGEQAVLIENTKGVRPGEVSGWMPESEVVDLGPLHVKLEKRITAVTISLGD